MIHWLIQSFDDCPEILRKGWTPDWLSPVEQQQVSAFKVEKRRQEWLLGRWTAKRLTQSLLLLEEGAHEWPLNQLIIAADASGAPYVLLNAANYPVTASGSGQPTGTEAQRLPFPLSISHSHGVAFCAIARKNDAHDDSGPAQRQSRSAQPTPPATQLPGQAPLAVGADIELIEARTATFVVDFFTPTEQAAVAAAPPELRDLLSTAIWSAKEAVLKALREGLRMDTRSVECLVKLHNPSPQVWSPFTIRFNPAAADGAESGHPWSGWWRIYQNRFVLTLALRTDS